MDDLLTTNEAAERLGVGPTAIKRWADGGLLPCIKTAGGHRRFRIEDVERVRRSEQARDESLLGVILQDRPGLLEARLLALCGELGGWHRVLPLVGQLLDEIGDAWARCEITIMQEHLASIRLTRALAWFGDLLRVAPGAPRGLLVCPEGEDHTLGLSMVELLLREAGWQCRWAGRATPVEEAIRLVDEGGVEGVFASASVCSTDSVHLEAWARRVAAACAKRRIPLVLGGRGAWPESVEDAIRLHDLRELRLFVDRIDAESAR